MTISEKLRQQAYSNQDRSLIPTKFDRPLSINSIAHATKIDRSFQPRSIALFPLIRSHILTKIDRPFYQNPISFWIHWFEDYQITNRTLKSQAGLTLP